MLVKRKSCRMCIIPTTLSYSRFNTRPFHKKIIVGRNGDSRYEINGNSVHSHQKAVELNAGNRQIFPTHRRMIACTEL